MFENLLNLIVKASALQPSYVKEHCIAYKQGSSACSTCREVCPHQAVSFLRGREVVIDEIDCTGCGLCVEACPSQALSAKVSFQPGAPLKCSRVKGSAQTVQCLARLTPSDLLQLAGERQRATLVRGGCESCRIGSPEVPTALERSAASARELGEAIGRPLELEIRRETRYDATDDPARLSRRELLRGGWRNLQVTAADALAPLDPGGEDEAGLPQEMQRRYRLLERAEPAPEALVPWALPRVAEGCILCPVCTNVCPTKAFRRVTEPEGTKLVLEPERCLGCDACVRACPVKVISMADEVPWGELSGGSETAYFKDPGQGPAGSVSR